MQQKIKKKQGSDVLQPPRIRVGWTKRAEEGRRKRVGGEIEEEKKEFKAGLDDSVRAFRRMNDAERIYFPSYGRMETQRRVYSFFSSPSAWKNEA